MPYDEGMFLSWRWLSQHRYLVRRASQGDQPPAVSDWDEFVAASDGEYIEIPIAMIDGYPPGDASVADMNCIPFAFYVRTNCVAVA